MKKFSLLMGCLGCFIGLFGQNTIYFNKTFKPDIVSVGEPACLVLQDGYLFAGPFVENGEQSFHIRKTNLYGETEWLKKFHQGEHLIYAIGGGILIKTNDNNYMLIGSMNEEVNSQNIEIVMIKFDEQGGILWEKKQEKPNSGEYIYNTQLTFDNGYIMAGIQHNFVQNNRFFVLKTDSLGNEEWSHQYHPQQHGAAFSIFETDTGYVVSGYMQYPDTDHDMFVMGIDKQGGVLWEKNYGGNESDNACLITPIGNNYFLRGGILQNGIHKPFIAKLNSVGDTIWSKIIDYETGPAQEAPLQLTPDGGFVCLYSYDTDLGYRAPWFWRFTASGDTLWTRRIPGAPSNHNSYLKDIAPTHDGGWVLSGFDYSEQSSWVVKLDSLGYTCSYLGCDSTSVIDALPEVLPPSTSQAGFSLAPNPAHDLATIYLSQATTQNQRVDLFDVSGRLVKTFVLPNFATTYTFSVADLPVGVYVCRIKGIEQVQKLVILK